MQVRFLSCCVFNPVLLWSIRCTCFHGLSALHAQGVLTFNTCNATENTQNVPPSVSAASSACGFLDAVVLPAFTRWDSAQFLNIAVRMGDVTPGPGHAWDGYYSESSHAFLPLFPLLVRLLVSITHSCCCNKSGSKETVSLAPRLFSHCVSSFTAGRIRHTSCNRVGRDASTSLRHRSCCFVESVR